jgi:hypothetical protein
VKVLSTTAALATAALLVSTAPAFAGSLENCRIQIQQAPVSANGNGVGPSSAQDVWVTGTNRTTGANPDGEWRFNGNICLGHLAKGFEGQLQGADGDHGHVLTLVPVAASDATLFTPSAGILGAGFDGYPIVDTFGTMQDPTSVLGLGVPFPGLAFDFDSRPQDNAEYDIVEGGTFWAAMELAVVNKIIDFMGYEVGDKLGLMLTWDVDPSAPFPQHNIEATGGWFYIPELQQFVPFLNEELLLFQLDCD